MRVRAKRQVFASDKPENHINEGKEKKKWKERGERKEGKKTAMVALLVFILATFWPKTKLLDGRRLFDSNVFKNSVTYICMCMM